MANWFDYLALATTLFVIAAIVFGGIIASKAISNAVQSTKENLKTRGVNLSKNGVAVKTNKRYDREDYLDATQRGFIKAMKASSGGNQAGEEQRNGTPPASEKSGYHLRSRKTQVVEK
ncbi:hypothetical protein ACG7TL_007961 [Trametes sanguinea]